MATSSHAIANAFIELAQEQGKQLTNMQLQKLVFLSQGFCLALHDRPIHYHKTHAWQFGPVIPKLYKSLQKYGSNLVTEPLDAPDVLDKKSEEFEVVKGVLKGYGHYTGGQLSTITHKKGSPWSLTWEREKFAVIPEELMKDYYTSLIEAA